MKNDVSLKLITLLLLLLSTLPVGITVSISSLSKLKHDAKTVNTIGFIRGSSQRLTKNIPRQDKEKIITAVKEKFYEIDNNYALKNKDYFHNSDFLSHYEELKTCWVKLQEGVMEKKASKAELYVIGEACWKSADAATNAAEKISQVKYDEIVIIIFSSGSLIFLLLVFTLRLIYTEVKNKLEVNVIQDELTKLYNRTHLLKILKSNIKSFERTRHPFSLLFIDIDHFKEINDKLGHSVGDGVLKSFADILQNTLREEDIAFRYGREEFVVLARYTNIAQAYLLAERIRVNVEVYNFKSVDKVTVSIGACEFKKGYSLDNMINYADDMMYQAKAQGRNRTCVH